VVIVGPNPLFQGAGRLPSSSRSPPVCRITLRASGERFCKAYILLQRHDDCCPAAVGDWERRGWDTEKPPPSPRKWPTCTRPAKPCLADLPRSCMQTLHTASTVRGCYSMSLFHHRVALRGGSIVRVVPRTRSEGSQRCLTGTGGCTRHLGTATTQSSRARDGIGCNVPPFRPVTALRTQFHQ
jgi:hypothetical protein